MEDDQTPKANEPLELKPGQTPVDLWPDWVDEKNIVLEQKDIDHVPDVINLLKLVNEYLKTPVYQLKPGEDYHRQFEEKQGDYHHDLALPKFLPIYPAYEKGKPFITRLIFYYGRHIEFIPFDYDPKWPGKDTPYGLINYHILGYRGIEQFLSNYARIRDYVVKALAYYYENETVSGEIADILKLTINQMTGEQYLKLLKEDRRRVKEEQRQFDYNSQLKDLY